MQPGSIKGSIVTLGSGTLGSSLLLLPYCFYEAGVIWGSIILIYAAAIGFFSTSAIVKFINNF